MLWKIAIAVLIASCFFGCVSPTKTIGPKVQATLSDGQKIVGYLATQTLTLESDLGTLAFAAADAGELGLLEGENIERADNMIRLWLRNGSEFVGRWQKPSVTVSMRLGGKDLSIQLPIAKLKRLQFHGEAVWPEQSVFRIVTHNGDDFFVDVTRTQMVFSNEMGTFSPFLSEIEQLQPMDDQKKQWNIHLANGSHFIAKLEQDRLDLHLSMGPEVLLLPLAAVKRMNRENIVKPSSSYASSPRAKNNYAPEDDYSGEDNSDGGNLFPASKDEFFSNDMQKAAKQQSEMLLEE